MSNMSKSKQSAVWSYFEGVEPEGGKAATCNLWKETVKTSGNTSNLSNEAIEQQAS